ncbi:MAG: helix-turn-helix domain-containing protein [Rhodospirillales bacterium]|nr:helix-turn-helix domain-containing protein [Acetobacter sp.]
MTSLAPYPPDALLTRRQVARWLAVSIATVKRMDRDGKLHPLKFNTRTIRYRASDVIHFLEQAAA